MGPVSDAADRAPALLPAADRALVRTVDGLDDEAWAAPSLLPGWTRAHVLAHLALNAEGLAGVLDGARRGRPQPMYASAEARDGDIEDLAAAGPAELRDRFLLADLRQRRHVRETPPVPCSPWHWAQANWTKSCAPAATAGSTCSTGALVVGAADVTVTVVIDRVE